MSDDCKQNDDSYFFFLPFSFTTTPINSPNKTMSIGAPWAGKHRRIFAEFSGVAGQTIREATPGLFLFLPPLRRAVFRGIPDHADLLHRDQSLADHFVDLRHHAVNVVLAVNHLDQDGKILA